MLIEQVSGKPIYIGRKSSFSYPVNHHLRWIFPANIIVCASWNIYLYGCPLKRLNYIDLNLGERDIQGLFPYINLLSEFVL